MPSPLIKSFAKKSHRSVKRVEKYWDEAKSAAAKHGLKTEDPGFWAYVNAIVQRRAGLRENMTFKQFLEDLGNPKKFKIAKGLSHKEAMKACPWKKAYGDCRGFGYDPKTGECVWH